MLKKNITVITLAMILFTQTVNAQCLNNKWTLVQQTDNSNGNRPPGINPPSAVFQVQYDADPKNCGCGYPVVAVGPLNIKNGYPATHIDIRLRGYGCDGKVVTGDFFANNIKAGQWDKGSGNWHQFKITGPTDRLQVLYMRVEYFDPELNAKYVFETDFEKGKSETYINDRPYSELIKEAQQTKGNLNTAITGYNKAFETAWANLSKIQDATQRANMQTRLTQNHDLFLQLDKQAQTQFSKTNGDAMQQTLDKIKQQQDDLSNIGADINTAAGAGATNSKTATANTPNNYNNKSSNSLYNGTVTNPQPKTNTTTTNNTAVQQFQQWQNNNAQTQRNINNAFVPLNNLIETWKQNIDAKYANDMNRIQNFSDASQKDLDNSHWYDAHNMDDSLSVLFHDAQWSLNQRIQFYNLSYWHNFKDYYPRESDGVGDYEYINIPQQLPDLFYVPTCNCFAKNGTNDTKYDSAFFYLRDSKKCKNIQHSGHSYSISIPKHSADNINEEKALDMLKNILQNATSPPAFRTIDLLKYCNAFIWYGYLQNKYAKTMDDLNEGYDIMKKWQYYDDNYYHSDAKVQKSLVDKLNTYEYSTIQAFNDFVYYFTYLFKYRIALTNKSQ